MNKPALIAAAVAIGAGGYFYTTHQGTQNGISSGPLSVFSKGPELSSTLAYVPEDSLFFYGNYQAVDAKLANTFFKLSQKSSKAYLDNANTELARAVEENPELKPLAYLLAEFSKALETPEGLKARFGIELTTDTALYTVGAQPVVRFKLSDEAAFNKFMADFATQNPDIKLVDETFEGVSYKSVLLTPPEEATFAKLIIAVNQGFAIISVDVNVERDTHLKEILGISKPSSSYANGSVLKATIEANKFTPPAVGLVNIEQILKGLTSAGSNRFANTLAALKTLTPESAADLDKLQTEACQKDFASIAAMWPRISFGFTQFDATDTGVNYSEKLVIENTNQGLMTSLQGLRGAIDSYISQPSEYPLLGIALGLNIDKLGMVLTDVQSRLTSTGYTCEALADIAPAAQEWPIAMLPMMTMQIAGVHGLSVSLMDLDLDLSEGMPKLTQLDALINLTAKNPQQLFSTISAMSPLPIFNQLVIPEDGSAVDLPLPIPPEMGVAPKIAIKGNNLVIFAGSKSEQLVNALSTSAKADIEGAGLLSFAVNADKMMPLFNKVAEGNPMMQAPEFASLKQYLDNAKGQATSAFDITDKGIEMRSQIQMNF